jgi:opacity protein-like surface antigen
MRTSFALLTSAVLLILPSIAFAQDQDQGQQGDCPPGSWFCDDSGSANTNAEEGDDQAPAADQDQNGDQSSGPEEGEAPRKAPSVKVYPPDKEGRRVIVVDRPEDVPKPPRRRHRRAWGINLRLEGVGMGSSKQQSRNSGMAGLGFSLRYRPVPNFALDAGVDVFGGTDWTGNKRNEDSFMLNGIVYFNPKNAVQVYTIGGIGFSAAKVTQSQSQVSATGNTELVDTKYDYRYFGGQLGIGLEFRLTHVVSLNVDALGFIRGRTDDLARTQPEFTDPDTGRTTNTSGGGLLRGGITFYW